MCTTQQNGYVQEFRGRRHQCCLDTPAQMTGMLRHFAAKRLRSADLVAACALHSASVDM